MYYCITIQDASHYLQKNAHFVGIHEEFRGDDQKESSIKMDKIVYCVRYYFSASHFSHSTVSKSSSAVR